MGSEESDQMMALLHELSMLKDADAAFEQNPTDSEREAHQLRQQRRDEIGVEMKTLAEQKEKGRRSSVLNSVSRGLSSGDAARRFAALRIESTAAL